VIDADRIGYGPVRYRISDAARTPKIVATCRERVVIWSWIATLSLQAATRR
jgi:hypothetical protein